MKHVKKSVLLWYSAREMYELVVDVESYPKFLPWCESSTILEQHEADPATGTPAGMTARLGLSYAGRSSDSFGAAQKAIRLSPGDPSLAIYYGVSG